MSKKTKDDTKDDKKIETDDTAPQKEKKKRKWGRKKDIEGGAVTWGDVRLFFMVIWRFIKAILKVVFAPFWYTGLLIVNVFRFLKTKSDKALTENEKKFLSLIPTMYFMLSICIAIVLLFVSFDVFALIWERITELQFWGVIVEIFKYVFWHPDKNFGIIKWIWLLIYYVFYKFFWEILIVGLSGLLQGQIWLASTIVLVALIVLTGIGLLLYYSTFMQKTIRSVRLFINNIAEIPKKIGLFFVNLHNQFREKFVLDILIGKNLISTKSKTFFWIIMFIQVVITIVFVLGAMILGIFNYATGVSSGAETMTYAMFVSFILFLFIGIFSTWFYHKILGTVTRPREDLDTKEKIPGRFEIKG